MNDTQNYLNKKAEFERLKDELESLAVNAKQSTINDIKALLLKNEMERCAVNPTDEMWKEDFEFDDEDNDYFDRKLSSPDDIWFSYDTRISNGAYIVGVSLEKESHLVVWTILTYSDYHDSHNCGIKKFSEQEINTYIPFEILEELLHTMDDQRLIEFNKKYINDTWTDQ